MKAKISVMIDTELWSLIRERMCEPEDSVSVASEIIDTEVNAILWTKFLGE